MSEWVVWNTGGGDECCGRHMEERKQANGWHFRCAATGAEGPPGDRFKRGESISQARKACEDLRAHGWSSAANTICCGAMAMKQMSRGRVPYRFRCVKSGAMSAWVTSGFQEAIREECEMKRRGASTSDPERDGWKGASNISIRCCGVLAMKQSSDPENWVRFKCVESGAQTEWTRGFGYEALIREACERKRNEREIDSSSEGSSGTSRGVDDLEEGSGAGDAQITGAGVEMSTHWKCLTCGESLDFEFSEGMFQITCTESGGEPSDWWEDNYHFGAMMEASELCGEAEQQKKDSGFHPAHLLTAAAVGVPLLAAQFPQHVAMLRQLATAVAGSLGAQESQLQLLDGGVEAEVVPAKKGAKK